MNNIIFPVSLLLFAIPSAAMEKFPENSCCLKPPRITYGQYAYEILAGGDIQGWGNATGSLGTWLGNPGNRKLVTAINDKACEQLPLFLVTPKPVVKKGRKKNRFILRCDYYLPAPNADLSHGYPTVSLYRKATVEEKALLKALPKESRTTLLNRLLTWQNECYMMTVTPKPKSLMNNDIAPGTTLGGRNIAAQERIYQAPSPQIPYSFNRSIAELYELNTRYYRGNFPIGFFF